MKLLDNHKRRKIQKSIDYIYDKTIALASDRVNQINRSDFNSTPSNGLAANSSLKYKKGRLFTSNRAELSHSSAYNMERFLSAYETESYITRAVNQYVHSVLQRGYKFVGDNAKSVEYINNRISAMCSRTNQTFRSILGQSITNLYMYGNTFCSIYRSIALSDGNIWYKTSANGRGAIAVKPIAGIFPQDTTGMRIEFDSNKNRINRYYMNAHRTSGDSGESSSFYNQMFISNDEQYEWKRDEMLHLRFHPQAGRIWAMPPLQPVLEDVLVLREIEENVQLLIHQHGHPFLQVKVNHPDKIERRKEINNLKQEVSYMEGNGMLFTGELVEIKNMNTDKGGMDLQGYLSYFQQRVFTGLFTSGVSMGQGDTANSSTSTVIDKKQQEVTKELQEILKDSFQDIFDQLLMEAGLTMQEIMDNRVELFFPDPDLDSLIKKQEHAINLYLSNAITEPELRDMIGKRAFTEEERNLLYYRLIEEEKERLTSSLAPNTLQTQKKVVNSKGNSKTNKTEGVKKKIENKNNPSNQYGKKVGPGSAK